MQFQTSVSNSFWIERQMATRRAFRAHGTCWVLAETEQHIARSGKLEACSCLASARREQL
eukprot:8013944-Lingulodinium_polyedra.AAC.1